MIDVLKRGGRRIFLRFLNDFSEVREIDAVSGGYGSYVGRCYYDFCFSCCGFEEMYSCFW